MARAILKVSPNILLVASLYSGAVRRTGRRIYFRAGSPRHRTDRWQQAVRHTPRKTSCLGDSCAGNEDTACRDLPASRAGNGQTGGASLVWRTGGAKDGQEV